MIPAEVMAQLATLGLSADQAKAVASMLSSVERATKDEGNADIEARRANDRERKARQRLVLSREVTGQDVTSGTKESAPQTPLKENNKKPPSGSKKAIGTRLPDDFKPDIEWAISQGLSRRTAEMQAAKFLDHWPGKSGKDGVKSDWPATWRNWVRSHLERIGADAPSTATDLPEDQWRKRLAYARRQQAWSTADWGPPPGAHGCRAPPSLLEPGDGAGWGEWKSAAA